MAHPAALVNLWPAFRPDIPPAGRLVLRAAIAHPGVEIVAVNDPFVDAGEWLVPSKPLMLQSGRVGRYALLRQGMYGC